MTTNKPKDILDRLEHLMHGYNYEVSLGVDLLEKCNTLEDFYSQLKLIHKDIKPEASQLATFNEADFWEEVNFGFTFRGDETAGLALSPEEEKALTREQAEYKSFIQKFLSDDTKIYSYPNEEGIPFYMVYWGYAFILLNDDRPSLFIYGAASD